MGTWKWRHQISDIILQMKSVLFAILPFKYNCSTDQHWLFFTLRHGMILTWLYEEAVTYRKKG